MTLADLLGSVPVQADGYTTRELVDLSGRSRAYIERWLRKAIDAGQVVYAGVKAVKSITGVTYPVPSYQIGR